MQNVLLPFDPALACVPVHAVGTQGLEQMLVELGGSASSWSRAQGFRAERGAVLCLPGEGGEVSAVLLGVGEAKAASGFDASSLASSLPKGVYRLSSGFEELEQNLLGFALASYVFDAYSPSKREALADRPTLMVSEDVDFADLAMILDGVKLARDLINTPANDLGPEELCAAALELFDAHGGVGEVVVGDALLEKGFPMVHAVGRASSRAPRLVDLHWGEAERPKVTLVGKGVIFDTGGLNIKPSGGMGLMKKDMGGAANVLGLASMIMAAKLPVRLRVIIPAVENAISGGAFRPGDILPSRKGLTVEIGNTDAEGRLVLADALALADEEAPELLVDMATLTGAARVALGPELPPLYTDDDELAQAIARHGSAVSDPTWRMPLWKPYMKYLNSTVADINHINTSGAGFAGSVTAALFLSRFVENAASWAHLDIYGWSTSDGEGRRLGGEAQAIRALFSYLRRKY